MACIIYIQTPPPPVDCCALSFQPARWMKAVVIDERLAAPWHRSLVAYYGTKPSRVAGTSSAEASEVQTRQETGISGEDFY